MMLVDETTTTLVAATPPIVTLVAPVKLVPVIVIGVPPAVGPVAGETDEIVGGGKYVNASAALAAAAAFVSALLLASIGFGQLESSIGIAPPWMVGVYGVFLAASVGFAFYASGIAERTPTAAAVSPTSSEHKAIERQSALVAPDLASPAGRGPLS